MNKHGLIPHFQNIKNEIKIIANDIQGETAMHGLDFAFRISQNEELAL